MAETQAGTLKEGAALISHAACGMHDTGWGHPEHTGRLRAVQRAVARDAELFLALRHVEGRQAALEDLFLCHSPAYVESVRGASLHGGARLDADTVVSSGSWEAALHGVGSLLDGVELALSGEVPRSFCAVRPPGHHALAGHAMGFCLFGNVAIAARHAQIRGGVERVLIVDWDVHHGNGTEALIESDPNVRFVSMHQWPHYPGSGAAEDRGCGNVWNIPLPAGLRGEEYVDALLHGVVAATTGFTPDIVVVSSGFDSMLGDPLGGFTLQEPDVYRLTRELVAFAEVWCGGRLVSALEGGYDTSILGPAAAVHIRALAGLPPQRS